MSIFLLTLSLTAETTTPATTAPPLTTEAAYVEVKSAYAERQPGRSFKVIQLDGAKVGQSRVEMQNAALGGAREVQPVFEKRGDEHTAKGLPQPTKALHVLTCRVVARVTPDADLAALAEASGALKGERPPYAPGYAVFTCGDQGASLAVAANLRGKPGVLEAAPIFASPKKARLIPNDTFFSNNAAAAGYQWHLRNTGARGGTTGIDLNLITTWDTRRGAGRRIAVIDDGIEGTHPDLSANFDSANSYDFVADDTDPSPQDGDAHGTACAGLAAARGNNSQGVAGVAYEAFIAGLRTDSTVVDDAMEAEALAYRNNVLEIKSISTGPADDGFTLEGPGPLTAAALQDGATNGRGGRGTIFLWAGGNGATTGDNANYDGYANSIYTLAITSVSDQGLPTDYAEPGACLICAVPGSNLDDQAISTLDLTGAAGDNDGSVADDYTNADYTAWFGGTSACAPLAAGVVALMLQANPNLGWRDVQEILLKTSRKIHAADQDWATNAAGFRFNHKYGAGLADAGAAVTAASTWSNLGAQTSTAVSQTNLNLAIPDDTAAGITRSFTISNSLRVEHVTLTADIDHTARGDLEIVLRSPSGMVSRLAEEHSDGSSHYASWTFSSVRHWGENSVGTWTVKIADREYEDTGTIKNLTLTIYGTPAAAPSGAPVVAAEGGAASATATAVQGAPFSYQITATNAPTSFSATGLPAGLSVNASGLISGSTSAAVGTVNATISATNGLGTGNRSLQITIVAPSALANGIDLPGALVQTGGDASWTRVTTPSFAGGDSVRAGTIADDGLTWIKAVIEGPTLLAWNWRASSEAGGDVLFALINEEATGDEISGTATAWPEVRRFIPPGRHVVRWAYAKDSDGAAGADTAYLDNVRTLDPDSLPPFFVEEPQPYFAGLNGRSCFSVSVIGKKPITFQWRKGSANVSGTQFTTVRGGRTLLILPTSASDVGAYSCVATNSLGSATSSAAALNVNTATVTTQLRDALDNPSITWGTGGNAQWTSQTIITADGEDALQSGTITHNQASTVMACIIGPGILRYQWNVSCEARFDFLGLFQDGIETNFITGEPGWQEATALLLDGPNIVQFDYYKDSSDSAGSDRGWLDKVAFSPGSYAAWAAITFSPAQLADAAISGASNDPDSDGIKNLLEYALGLDPLTSSLAGLPQAQAIGNALTFDFPRNSAQIDVDVFAETSSDLQNWTRAEETLVDTNGDIDTMRVSLPITTPGAKFIRLRVNTLP